MYVRNGYDGDSETVNVLATSKAHCIETLNCNGNTLVQERSFRRIAVQSVALLSISAMRL